MTLRERAMRGLNLSGLLLIDAHTHIGVNTPRHPCACDMVALMDDLGIRKCVTSSWVGLSSDYVAGNDMVLRAMQEFPGRFAGLCVINPHDSDEIVPEIEKRISQGFVGVKILPFLSKCHAADPCYRLVYECANQHKLIVKSHTYRDGHPENACNHPALFDAIAREYKHAHFILAHAGGAPAGFRESIDLARKHDNIYLEFGSTLSFTSHWLQKILEGVGSDDKLFYGSDSMTYDPRPAIGEVLYARIPDSSKEKILGRNIDRLLNK